MKRGSWICGRLLIFSFVLLIQLFSNLPVYSPAQTENQELFVEIHTYDMAEFDYRQGDLPYLHNDTYALIYTKATSVPENWDFWEYYFLFEDLNTTYAGVSISNCTFHVEMDGEGQINVNFYLFNGASWIDLYEYNVVGSPTGFLWYNYSIFSNFNTREHINVCKLRIFAYIHQLNRWLWIRRAYLNITFRESWVDPSPPLEDYIPIGYGIGGLGILTFLPLFLVLLYRKKKESFWEWIPWAFCLFWIAIACVVAWLWG